MMEIMLYRCDYCGYEYSSKKECEECEKTHDDLKPVEICGIKPFLKGYYNEKPPVISVKTKGGQVWEYVARNEVAPEKAEGKTIEQIEHRSADD